MMRFNHKSVWRRFIAFALLLGMLFGASPALALANISRSFSSHDPNLVPGCLVSAQSDQGDTVTLANTSNGQRLLGVVVPTSQSLLAIDASNGKVQVALSGVASAFVSSLGGDIKTGDQIAVSPISGIGMKAGDGMRIIGIAQQDFNSQTSGAAQRVIQDKSGEIKTVFIAPIPIAIAIGYATASGSQQGFLGQLGSVSSVIAGHSVSSSQAVLSFLIAVIALAALIALVYGAIHGSLISIGRNPLSRTSIYRSLLQIVAMALLIVIVAVVIVYFILV